MMLSTLAAECAADSDRWLVHGDSARTQQSIDIFCLQGAQQQTSCTQLLLSIDRMDRHLTII